MKILIKYEVIIYNIRARARTRHTHTHTQTHTHVQNPISTKYKAHKSAV